jgi:hypothetical protein
MPPGKTLVTTEEYVGQRGLDKHGQKKWRRHVAMTMPAGYRPPATEATRGPVRISVGRELLSAPPRVSPAPTTEEEHHCENDH